ncbi:hypothetical protein PC9H_010144 [Pleurotus ostreatus]|uniref:Uncharacterized protein n=1 Tax=Pleurotus ostreatus TaxID=5322 RepID=A0A8H6ZN46_PLEOS|nr:uncharacterized protein PC9H_010144 [Pleurotus ostreatus]KAF7424833.1 hypothetical protein PC9H_010144 [Pleurotus ostreatus]
MCLECDPWGSDAVAMVPEWHYSACYSQPDVGECVLIRSTASSVFRAFVSSYQGGNNAWFTLRSSFGEGRWNRRGWDVLVCTDGKDTWRMGAHIYIKRVTVYVTVKGVGDVEIEYGRDGAYKADGGSREGEMSEATRRSELVARARNARLPLILASFPKPWSEFNERYHATHGEERRDPSRARPRYCR